MSCAVRNLKRKSGEDFTERYQALLRHFGMDSRHTQPASPHENGKVEQRHHRLKRAIKNELILRGSNDFESRQAYEVFLEKLFGQLNAERQERFKEEQKYCDISGLRALWRILAGITSIAPEGHIQTTSYD